MSQDNFWDNRNYAQKLVDESSAIKRRIEPLLKAESQQSDMETMLEILPDDEEIDGDKLTDEQFEVIERVEAIEQEWIIDPDRRKELTLIQWTD
jgi:hypothetical protein